VAEMPLTKENLLRHELIGLKAKIVNSSDPSLLSVHGKVVDETKEMLVVELDGKAKSIPKSTSVFLITLPDGEKVKIDGKRIIGRPQDRIKKIR
jgi:ribonuclease P protein subunit POP4